MVRVRGLFVVLLAAWLMVALGGSAQAGEAKRKLIIDDEGFGLMHLMLLEDERVDVLGITTVSGNAWVNRATAFALRGLEGAARTEVPVVPGATYPLVNSEAQTERWEALYGKLVWKGAWMKQWVEPTQQSTPPYFGPHDRVDLPWGNPRTKPSPEIAANFLIRMVRAYPGQVTIIAAGPLTNLALAQRLDPEFAGLAAELVYMGGSLNPRQTLDNRSAHEFAREFSNTPRREFNMRFDPEAASIVSRSAWRKLTIVPVDPSTATQLTKELRDRLIAAASPGVARLIRDYEIGFPLWDEVAAGIWLDPSLVTESESLFVDYNINFSAGYGDLLSWHKGYQPGVGEQEAKVILAVDAARLDALMLATIANSRTRVPHD